LPDKNYLAYVFSWLLDNEILTPNDYENLKEKGIAWLNWYYDLYSSKNTEPLMLEYNFRQRNIVFEWIPLTWAIDKIEKVNWLSSSNNTHPQSMGTEGEYHQQMAFFKETVALVDYKTWKPKTIWEIKWIDRYWNKKPWEWKYFRQVLFYKLLCELDFEFTSKFDIWSIALDFVEWKDWVYKYVEIDYTVEDFENFKTELKESRTKIKDIDFWRELLKQN
jgi:DNA helicase-2/ATP-dependent DNA helicase PcrA